jgi:hypothetical protein
MIIEKTGIELIPNKPTLNWNDMSDLGLLYAINKLVLHPIGLAVARDPDTGESVILKAKDGVFEYGEGVDERNIKRLQEAGLVKVLAQLSKQADWTAWCKADDKPVRPKKPGLRTANAFY